MDFIYPIHILDDRTFEILITSICKNRLGIGTNGFNGNKDGGRDARFEGTAQNYPSTNDPWKGKFIIQAKHTVSPIALCSESSFRATIDSEIIKIKELRKRGEVDNYLIFTNRSLTGNEQENICKLILDGTGVEKTNIHGKEDINDHLVTNEELAERVGLNKYVQPLVFHEKDMKNLILYFGNNIDDISKIAQETHEELKRVNVEEKNKKNNLSQAYFELMKEQSLSYFHKIDIFLKDPKNIKLLNAYQNTTTELNNKITIYRKNFSEFEKIFDHIYEHIVRKHEDEINDQKRLIWVFLHYMYYNCDIGLK